MSDEKDGEDGVVEAKEGTAEVKEKAVVHPLFEKEIRPTYNWHEWLAEWESAKGFYDLESLFHRGFTVALEKGAHDEIKHDYIDRLIIYFSIADGWESYDFFERPKDRGIKYFFGYRNHGSFIEDINKTPAELRQLLALKAFDLLCLNFFKVHLARGEESEFGKFWYKLIYHDFVRLLSVIMNFFRVEKKIFGDFEIRNLSDRSDRSHNEQQAINFLIKLVRFIWEWKEPVVFSEKEQDFYRAVRVRVDSTKPWTIEILSQLKMLDVLQEHIFEFDQPCLDKLKEIALRAKLSKYSHQVREDRRVATFLEACYVGSRAALFLEEYEIRMAERKRLSSILEAEGEIAGANQRIAELSAPKKQ